MELLKGHITKFTYLSPAGDFRVGRFRIEKQPGEAWVSGNLAELKPGNVVDLYGEWTSYTDKKGAERATFKVQAAIFSEPHTTEEMFGYLVAAVPGVGKHRAQLLINRFGNLLPQILEERPDRLLEIPGISKDSALRISAAYKEQNLERPLMMFLNSIGVGVTFTKRILRDLGPGAKQIIQQNPYRLIEVSGIGFTKADEIAQTLGWKKESAERIDAVLTFVLEEATKAGHSYLPRTELVSGAVTLGGLEAKPVEEKIDEILKRTHHKTLVQESVDTIAGPVHYIYLPRLYAAERKVCDRVMLMKQHKPVLPLEAEALKWHIAECEKARGLELTDEQRAAAYLAFSEPISILTGGPGTGKTSVLQVIVDAASKLGLILKLCAPTGRAAQHMGEVTEHIAQTIHMLCGYDPDVHEWKKNANDPLEADMVICDEFSMADVDLASRILDAVRLGRPVVIVGDKDQLPAVSPGRVLDDLISSGLIPMTRLTKVFRQAEKSLIIQNAHLILKGEEPVFPKGGGELSDCFIQEPPEVPAVDEKGEPVLSKQNKQKTVEKYSWIKERILQLCQQSIPNRMKLNPIRDIQVLTPMKDGPCGVHELNLILQDALNPYHNDQQEVTGFVGEVICGSKRFRLGDRVLQVRNNYKLGICNGDIGFVIKIDEDEKLIHIDFGIGRNEVKVSFQEAVEDLQLGYVLSIHKSQGGEFPAVIVVLLKRNWIMLQRNLLYTAITRAKNLLVVVGKQWVINQAVGNSTIHKRNSLLPYRFKQAQKLIV